MEEGEVLDPQAALLGWYEKVYGRNVDLVGDYAGNELFLVEGDSLILHCLDNVDVDFNRGFQLLHAVHSVEAFLAALLRRKANFHIAFFEEHAPFCIPAHVADRNTFKYKLCRAIIIRHLSMNLPTVHPSVKVMRFKSYRDHAFVEYIHKSGLYFVMCHDGASATMRLPDLPDDAPGKNPSGDVAKMPEAVTKSEKRRRQVFRRMIFWFISRGINIALTNSVEWHDTKIMAMVQERSRKIHPELRRAREVLEEPPPESEDQDAVQSANTGDFKSAFIGIPGALPNVKSESYCLVVAALHSLLAAQPESKSDATTFIVHSVLLRHIPLAQRRLPSPKRDEDQTFLKKISDIMQSLLNHPQWQNALIGTSGICDVADLIDGRLLSWVFKHPEADVSCYGSEAASEIEMLLKAISVDSGPIKGSSTTPRNQDGQKSSFQTPPTHRLLPFTNPVFDKHLQSIHVEVEKSNKIFGPAGDTAKTFRELTHWHNSKPLQRGPKPVLTEWQKKRAMRSNHIFQRELHQYAVSLTSSVGKALNPERIHTGETSVAVAPKSASADAMKADNVARIADRNEKKFVAAWQTQIKDFAAIKDHRARFTRANNYLATLPHERRDIIGSEVELYMLNTLVTIWTSMRRDNKSEQYDAMRFAGLIFEALNRMQKVDGSSTTKAVQRSLQTTNDSLGLAFQFSITSKVDRPLSFQYALQAVDPSMKLKSALEFELNHCGPYLDRSIDSAPDSRVKFEPDGWQRRVLDLIDEKKSVLVVAPTSAGKTFISFYAMKQVLQETDDGILVYVAPTKALVNQIAAELQAQFSKNYKYPGKSVWAIHTRDYRVNDPQGCQILVTVPHILQIMLLAPSNAKSGGWSQRVKRIIFDEIHCIGQAEDGVVWEQLLLLSPCPIIALSATVGNPQEFTSWLQDTQSSMGYELNKVEHPYRYSDLRKFVYQPPPSFKFQPLEVADTLGLPSLDGASGLMYMHPVAALINESRGMPHDLHLEPRDCLSLWTSMKKHSNELYPVDDSLDPTKIMPAIIKKVDVLSWESELKSLLKQWMVDSQSPFRLVIEELSRPLHTQEHANGTSVKDDERVDPDDLLSTTLPLLHTLDERNALPAILFNYDRSACENIGQDLLAKLAKAEEEYKSTSPIWKKKLTAFENWKKVEAKKSKRAPAKKSKGKGEDDDDEGSKADREKEAAELESNPFASFDPDTPIPGFVFADEKALLPSEFAGIKKRLEYRHIAPWLIDALERGIGVHHAGMNRAYRQAVETLFRKRFLRVVVATGTLALGINMPCKTVVFSGDSVFLTALNYRQGAGRAGRRGFDLLGNVVFQNIQLDKICRLVSSRLPDLNGHFPITTTLVLRLFSLLHESKGSAFAKKSIDSLLSQPRLFLGGEAFKDQVLHHLRYSIEYLRRQHLISDEGRPINFAGTVSHLYFTENSSFAFHTLLKDGYFNKLCAGFKADGPAEPRVLDTLMLTLSHLFGRRHCRRADQEFVDQVVKKYSSHVFLPKMPEDAEKILMAHNSETLDVFSTYVRTFVAQHTERMGTDRRLPLTEMLVGGEDSRTSGIESLPPTIVRSAFVALSGHDDEFASIAELCRTVRDGVFLESSTIPHVALYPQEAEMPLNAYLYDFYRHGDVATIEKANGVRRGDIWFLLNDFSMVLATVVTSFKNFMNMDEDADLDFVEVAGSGDLHEIDEDDRIARQEESSQGGAQSTLPLGRSAVQQTQTLAAPSTTQLKKKKKVVDSWDEDDDAASSSSAESDWDAGASDDDAASTSTRPTTVSSSTPAWEEESGEGLKNVAIAFQRLKVTFEERFKKMWA